MSRENSGESSSRRGCAACKHQRRRCKQGCFLQPYFGVERTNDFQAAQKVFGISSMNKMMRELEVNDRPKAIESLVWEAWLWKQDKINGPLGHYRRLQQENVSLKNQIHHLNQQLQILTPLVPNNNGFGTNFGYGSESSGLDLAVVSNNVDFVGIPMNGYSSTTSSWPIQQRQELVRNHLPRQDNSNSGLINYGINGQLGSLVVPSLQTIVPTQQRENLGATQEPNSFNAQASHQGFYDNGQISVSNTNSMHGQGQRVPTQQSRGDFHGPRPRSSYVAPSSSNRVIGREVRYAPYELNRQFRVQRHERDINNLNFQHVQQFPNLSQQQANGSQSCIIQDQSRLSNGYASTNI